VLVCDEISRVWAEGEIPTGVRGVEEIKNRPLAFGPCQCGRCCFCLFPPDKDSLRLPEGPQAGADLHKAVRSINRGFGGKSFLGSADAGGRDVEAGQNAGMPARFFS